MLLGARYTLSFTYDLTTLRPNHLIMADMVQVETTGKLPTGISKTLISSLVNVAYKLASEDAEVEATASVSVVGEVEIRLLNRQYRGKDSVTDVLSFGYSEDDAEYDVTDKGEPVLQLGDIVVCLPQVKRQAKATGKLIREEFALMVVHGTLHLLGFDHVELEEEKVMFALQNEVLIRTGIL